MRYVRTVNKDELKGSDQAVVDALEQVQQDTEDAFRPIGAIVEGALRADIYLTPAATTVIAHGLRRVPRGYIIVASTAATSHYLASSDDQNIGINSSVGCTVSVWVF